MTAKPMTILHYVDENRLAWAEPWFQLLKALEGEGVENVILCRPAGDLAKRAEEKGFRVLTYRPPVTAIPQICRGVRTIIGEVNPDIIHTRLSSAAALGGYWGRKENIPVLSTIDKYPKAKYYQWSDMLIPCSTAVADHMASVGFSRDRMKIIHNPIDIVRYKKNAAERQKLRNKSGLTAEQIVFLGAGRFVDWKAFKDLVSGFHLFLKDQEDKSRYRLWLVGDGPERESLEKQVDELGIRRWTTFWGFATDIRPFLWASDVFIQPSNRPEGFSLMLLEAMAAGLPPVVTRIGGTTDIVEDGISGVLVDPGDVCAIAEGMARFSDKTFCAEIAKAAAETASRFGMGSITRKCLQLYQQVLSGGPSNRFAEISEKG